ncbi:MAG: hypothetical protein E5X35_11710 [Mesorhizobium sp.]|nr:hypothetical protein [Mesorhizobium sp.]TIR33324.1 MAG: hypothetical protein E5X35_11710 [Mesorhizobium sp.]
MLQAGGVKCIGDWPAFETSASMFGSFDPAAFAALRGTAIKLIDPARLPIGAMPNHIVIWLDRGVVEQARSQIKMVRGFGGPVASNRQTLRAMVSGLRSDRAPNMAAIGAKGRLPSIALTFDRLLTHPTKTAADLYLFLRAHGYELDLVKMVKQIRGRSPACYPGMMEIELLGQRGIAA